MAVLTTAIPITAAIASTENKDDPNEPDIIARGAIIILEQISIPVEVIIGDSFLNRLPKIPAKL